MAPDTTMAAPSGHQFFRGFGGYNRGIFEVRMDFSQSYCTSIPTTSSAAEECVSIETKSGGNWLKVSSATHTLDFVADTFLPGFRAYNLFKRGTHLELWGSQIVAPPVPDQPCIEGGPSPSEANFSGTR
jgi:hypothetical protein